MQELLSKAIRGISSAQAPMTHIVDCLWAHVVMLEPDQPHHVFEDVIKSAQAKNEGLNASAIVRCCISFDLGNCLVFHAFGPATWTRNVHVMTMATHPCICFSSLLSAQNSGAACF